MHSTQCWCNNVLACGYRDLNVDWTKFVKNCMNMVYNNNVHANMSIIIIILVACYTPNKEPPRIS